MKIPFIAAVCITSLMSTFAQSSKVPTLPESKAQVFNYENGLTLIVEEDRSAPVASVQA